MNTYFLTPLTGLIAVLLLGSCASISVKPGTECNTPLMPKKIYVSTFNVKTGVFNVDRENAELLEFKKHLQSMMQTAIVTELTNRIVSATPSQKGHEFDPADGWLIRGEFTKVNQGSRLLRSTIGLGAGGTKMETKIYVYDLSQDTGLPILTFSTTGGSNAEPGAITAIATDPLTLVLSAGIGAAPGAMHGITEDTKRTAHEITAQISTYMYKRGWINKDKWIKPKNFDQ